MRVLMFALIVLTLILFMLIVDSDSVELVPVHTFKTDDFMCKNEYVRLEIYKVNNSRYLVQQDNRQYLVNASEKEADQIINHRWNNFKKQCEE